MRRFFPVLVLPFLLATIPVRGQDAIGLVVGERIERNISAGEKHTYILDLPAGQFVYGEVHQPGVDVVIAAYGPENQLIDRFDSEAKGWDERLQLESAHAGPYRIEVSPYLTDSGVYAIEVKEVTPLAATPQGRADQLMAAYYRDDHPGVIIAVVRDGETAFAEAYGMANLTHGIPFTTETASNISRVAKQFTGFALAMLEKEGRLSLDDDVREHLPELPNFSHPIRLRHLLNHTSGLREAWHTFLRQGVGPEDTWTREEIIRCVRRQRELQHVPGEEYNYTNTNYILLAEVVERVTGVSFSEWMAVNVFGPLGMENTTVKTVRGQVIPNSAQGYGGNVNTDNRNPERRLTADEGGFRECDDLDAFYGASSIYSTVGDLTKWLRNFNQARVGGPGVISRMTEPAVLSSGDTIPYGLGLHIDTYRGLRRYRSRGMDGGHRASVVYYPEVDFGLLILGNNEIFRTVEEDITYLFIGEHMAPEEGRETEESTVASQASADRTLPRYEPSDKDLSAYAGLYYSSELETAYTITVEDGRPTMKHHRLADFLLEPEEPDSFSARWPWRSVRFQRSDGGAVSGFVVESVRFKRIE